MARPKTIVWPIGFDDLLRYAMPLKRFEDRYRFYRLFLRDFIRPNSIAASLDEVEKRFVADKQRQFDENEAYHIRLRISLNLEKWKQEHHIIRASKAAKDKATQEKFKKFLLHVFTY